MYQEYGLRNYFKRVLYRLNIRQIKGKTQGMNSISRKILRTTLFWLILCVILLTVTSLAVVSSITNTNSEDLITQICEKETFRFDSVFSLLENNVSTIEQYIKDSESQCTSKEELLSDKFCQGVQDITLRIANHSDGAMAVYFRYNPELTGNGTQGFFWSRNDDSEEFSYFEPTDILQYDQDDTEHVGWFYEPKRMREAMWMSPYFNKNLDVFMISYIIPYYTKSGDFLGVIGMDIDFNKILKLTEDTNIYQSGKIQLIDLSTYLVYRMENGEIQQQSLSTSQYNHITRVDSKERTLTVTGDDGREYLTCADRLLNNMRIMIAVPTSEVNAQKNEMIMVFAVLVIAILTVCVIFVVNMTEKIVIPLKKLTSITGKYAKGDWDDTFTCDTNDEIQELSESISIMAETTKAYIEKINENATTDALTGLKNKNCYLSYIEKLKNDNDTEKKEYAVGVFDLNHLKNTNDNYGHETGDKLIKQASKYICDIFKHSPVFRIGGDEFVVILDGRDFNKRQALCDRFLTKLKDIPAVEDDISLSISFGMASTSEDVTDYDEIFRIADERMYECKKLMKAGRENE